MSGAVPSISPVTGGAIYEATAKAEKAYADAELSADVEYTELQKMTSKANQAELTKGWIDRNDWPELICRYEWFQCSRMNSLLDRTLRLLDSALVVFRSSLTCYPAEKVNTQHHRTIPEAWRAVALALL